MHAGDIELTTGLEERHWWYKERRAHIAREARRLGRPGRAIEIGAAGGGNSRELMRLGWDVLATEYLASGVRIAHDRGVPAIQADGRCLPVRDASFDLLVAYDVLEHIDDDNLAAAELTRVLKPGGMALIAVPCDMKLWSEHDVASGHFRRYDRAGLTTLIEKAGLRIESVRSWNVLLRPAMAIHRRSCRGNDVTDVHPVMNAALGAVIRSERYLPVGSLPGVSLMLRARRPITP